MRYFFKLKAMSVSHSFEFIISVTPPTCLVVFVMLPDYSKLVAASILDALESFKRSVWPSAS